MAVFKSAGITPSERLLTKLCEQTFLGFWSYANTYRDQGGPKELCDLLVIYGNHIVLFSDKSCAFPDSGDVSIDWSRWFRKTILGSAKQVRGAERWLRQHPDRVFVDNKCSQRLPLALDHVGQCTFHRVIVALGAQERCRSYLGEGSGSLALVPEIVGEAHFERGDAVVKPFCIGRVDTHPGYLHVFDDVTLPLILKEADTIADFIAYLEFKEQLLGSDKVGRIAGEENLLAMFLTHFVHTGGWRSLLNRAVGGNVLDIRSGGWNMVTESAWYREAREFLKHSYVWDAIIQEFATHAFGGTLYGDSPQNVASNEEIFRCMAGEPRVPRAYLTAKMLERWTLSQEQRVEYRIVESPTFGDTLYVFVFVPNEFGSFDEYREVRQAYLRDYCFLVHSKNRKYHRVVGVATDSGDQPYRTFDAVLVEGDEWSPEMEAMAKEIERDLGVSGRGTIHRISDPPPAEPQPMLRTAGHSRQRKSGRVGRNDSCPCQSGKKFKRCCLPRLGE